MLLAFTVTSNISWENVALAFFLCMCGMVAINVPYLKRKGAEKECHVIIKSKSLAYSNTPQIYYRGNRWNYLVVFVDDLGKEMELFVSECEYIRLQENSVGVLTYQGDNFIEFIPDELS